jgi:ankyrin repeat protein
MSVAQVRGFRVDAQAFFDSALAQGSSSIAERLFTAFKIDLTHRDLNVQDRDTRLVYAAACGSVMLLFMILRCAGQDVNCVVKLKWPPFSDACTALSRASDPDTIRFLLDAKADVNPEGCDTVLRGACEKLRPDAVKALLAAGAEVDRMGSYEGAKSALHYAVYARCTNDRVRDKIEVINMLFDAGADTRECGGGRSTLELGRMFCDSSYNLDAAFAAVLARDPGLVHCRDASGATPLLQVLRKHKDPALVKVLLDAKADVNAVDTDGTTALSQLVIVDDWVSFGDRSSSRNILRQLVAAGVNITQCVEGKDTALTRLMGPHRGGYQHWNLCEEQGPTAGHGILTDILDAILYRPVADGERAMVD